MLGQRFRWWVIIKLALCQRLVFAVQLLHMKLKGKSVAGEGITAPSLPPLTSTKLPSTVLCNIQLRSWLRHLSSKISTFVILKIDFSIL